MKIVVFHQHQQQTSVVCEALGDAGHDCRACADDGELLAQTRRDGCDLLVIDGLPPGVDIAALLSALREAASPAPPVLLIADRAAEQAVAAALDAGIDDYLFRPLRRGELLARTRILLRRAHPERRAEQCFTFEQYLFDMHGRHASIAGRPVELTHKEFELALLFFRNLGRPLSRATILEAVWSRDAAIPSRTVDTHVSRVRSKLGLEPENGFRLAPVYSYGYRLERLPG